jgi:hypothetical protein
MSASEVTMSFRIHTSYQALGRCSIRAAQPTTNPKTILVAGSEDAKFLHALFPGSRWLGQVGDLPNLRATAARTAKANKPEREDGKTVMVSKAILGYLDGLRGVDKISSRTLKEAIPNTRPADTRCSRALLLGRSPKQA